MKISRVDDAGTEFVEMPKEDLAQLNSEIAEYKQFIKNGVEFGYIKVPENSDDKAYEIVGRLFR